MLIITGVIITESAAEVERLKAALCRRAEKSRQDEGNIEYTFSVSVENANEIRLIEKWESEALLDAHLQVPDEDFNNAMAKAKIDSARVISNEVTSERVLLDR